MSKLLETSFVLKSVKKGRPFRRSFGHFTSDKEFRECTEKIKKCVIGYLNLPDALRLSGFMINSS